jgi:solute carrier family 66 (lysosomal lysine-arginine transporter), member 1
VPTVIALAVYFCFADLVLLLQCLYYNTINAYRALPNPRGGAGRQNPRAPDDPEQPLLARRNSDNLGLPGSHRRRSSARSSFSRHPRRGSHTSSRRRRDSLSAIFEEKETSIRVWVRNVFSVILVCAAGAGGWFIAWRTGVWSPTPDESKDGPIVDMALGPQILGYFSALCYLGYF